MRLKDELNVEIFVNESGGITLMQYDVICDENKFIMVSPEQFKKLSSWFFHHEALIAEAWNSGIDSEDEEEVADETDS
jgi:hypothetical protein